MRLFTVSKLFFVGVIVFSLLCFPQALSAQENALHVYTGGKLWGIWGMLVAVPLAAVLKVLVSWLYLKLVE
jgi:hypothetical protein